MDLMVRLGRNTRSIGMKQMDECVYWIVWECSRAGTSTTRRHTMADREKGATR
jgi:hypothetical protein